MQTKETQRITLDIPTETYVFFAELGILNNLPPKHFIGEAIETYKAYLLRELPDNDADNPETAIYKQAAIKRPH